MRKNIGFNVEKMSKFSEMKYKKGVKLLGIPKRYEKAQVSDFNSKVIEKACAASLITAMPGVGKTHLLIALAKQAVKNNLNMKTVFTEYQGQEIDTLTVGYVTVSDLLGRIKSSFSSVSRENELIELYSTAQNLFFDDYGAHSPTDWSFDILYRIIDYRYSNLLKTTIASNLSFKEIERDSKRISSRIIGMGNILTLDGKDKREEYDNNS